jgi:hypothetical protein
VAPHVIGLNVPQLKALFMREPGNSSQAIPANGIKIIPAIAETAFADMVAIEAFFIGRVKIHFTNKNSTNSPILIAHHEKSLVSR